MVDTLATGPVKLLLFDYADDGVTVCSYPQGLFENLQVATPVAEEFIKWGAVLVLAWSSEIPDRVYRFTSDGWGLQDVQGGSSVVS